MTDKPTPTPTEIIALAATEGVRVRTGAVAIKFALAVLAKWGTPAPVGVGEAAEHYRNAIASACEGWTMPDGLRKHLETALWSPPTPQPTQAQADSVQEDAALWHWLAEYLVGTRTDLDDEIVASETVNDLRKLVEAAIKQGATQ